MDSAGRIETIRELCSFEGRLAGTDAERRAANRLAERLAELGRRVDVEPIYAHPQVGLIVALHCLLGLAGSLLAVAEPAIGFALALIAATSAYLDLNTRLYLLRLLFFRRVSQNVVSPPRRPAGKARLVLSAHYDAGRTGAIFAPRRVRLAGRLGARLPFSIAPLRLVFWSLAALLPLLGARMAGVDSNVISLLQLAPTLILLVATFAAIELELSPIAPGANDNASGVATVLSLAEDLRAQQPVNLDVWIVLSGAGECLMEGMRAFLRGHRGELADGPTYFLCVDAVGDGELRYATGEGLAVTYRLRSRLTELCEAIGEGRRGEAGRPAATPLSHGLATDAFAAAVRRHPATAITCLDPGAAIPPRVHTMDDAPDHIDVAAVDRAHGFTLELIGWLDRDAAR
ncbi:MAG: M28 family peptidase [Solirubrobacterales bacterium]|nr:M28 family peptidase [Solirubrobacterales bacterium]